MSKIALLFAGQGAQSVGMCSDLYEHFACAREIFDSSPETRDMIMAGPKELLDVTINTQPAMFLADLACAAVLTESGFRAQGAAGFSLGEIPAACYAGLMTQAQAFDLVKHRAAKMQECSEKRGGCMFAVLKLDDIVVESICRSLGQAYPANYNCPGQLVVACADDCAEKLQQEVSGSGGKALKLAVSGAFHSPFMDDAAKAMAAFLESRSFGQPGMPLYANATAQVYGDPKELLAGQVNSPVLWRMTIENMIADGFDTFIEAGPGKTLSGLVRKICSDATVCNVSDLASLAHTLEMLEKR